MKRLSMAIMAMAFAFTASAQYYNVGTSKSSTDMFGNTTTTHRDQYGHTIGTSTSKTDMFGNTTTTYRDQYGHTQGSSTTSRDMFGNRNTQQRSNNNNSTIWTW